MNNIKKNSIYCMLGLGVFAVLAAAYFEGNATLRWGNKYNENLESFKNAVENAVPSNVGIWTADAAEDQIGIENENIRRVAGADGALGRHYRGSYDMPDVHVNITCGFSRTVGAHTPDVCFTGSGSIQEGDVDVFEVTYKVAVPDSEDPGNFKEEEREATFKTAIFSDQGGHYRQRVIWGWKGMETGWVAPRFPRLKWNSSEPVCKMYVSIIEGDDTIESGSDTLKSADEFLKIFLPELDKILTGKYVLPENLKIHPKASADEASAETAPSAETPAEQGDSKPESASDPDDFDLSVPSAPTTPSAGNAATGAAAPEAAASSSDGAKEEVDEFTL